MVKVNQVQQDDLMAFVHFVKVKNRSKDYTYGDTLTVDDVDNKKEFMIRGTELIEQGESGDRWGEEKTVNKTKLAELLSSAYNTPFTVCYLKKDGKERILRGRLIGSEPLMGRSQCEDLDLPEGKRFRLVCHRELRWLIVNNTKYLLKK